MKPRQRQYRQRRFLRAGAIAKIDRSSAMWLCSVLISEPYPDPDVLQPPNDVPLFVASAKRIGQRRRPKTPAGATMPGTAVDFVVATLGRVSVRFPTPETLSSFCNETDICAKHL
jgi:hypothetical protein